MRKLLRIGFYLIFLAGTSLLAFVGVQVAMSGEGATRTGWAGALSRLMGTTPSAPEHESEPAAGGASADPGLASIVDDYKRSAEMAKAAAAQASATDSAPAGLTTTAVAHVPAHPIRTPDATQKLIREWPTGRKWVALTFDDGPHPEFTPRFLELLREKNCPATFFLLGPNVKQHPEIVQEQTQRGFEIGNHSWKHPTLSKLPPERIREELKSTSDEIKAAAGISVSLMRPPYGSANKKVQDICEELGLKIICWSIDTDDWRSGTTQEKMEENVLKNAKDGSIILMHDRYEKSLVTTEHVIDKLRAQGYQFVTVSQLLGLEPVAPQAAPTPAVAQAAGLPGPSPVSAAALPAATPASAAHDADLPPSGEPSSLPAPSVDASRVTRATAPR